MGQNKASLVLPPDQVDRINDLLLRLRTNWSSSSPCRHNNASAC